jgi:hypothetical protein
MTYLIFHLQKVAIKLQTASLLGVFGRLCVDAKKPWVSRKQTMTHKSVI